MPREEANGRDRASFKPMKTHNEVIENFILEGVGGKGTYVKASDDLLISRVPESFAPFGRRPWTSAAGTEAPLAVRLKDGGILANGARLEYPMDYHQQNVLRSLEHLDAQFGVIPFHSIVAAWTDGRADDWNQYPIPIRDLKEDVEIVVSSDGERWREVVEKDKNGRNVRRQVHTLGDSVVRIKDRYYVSAVDETGVGSGMYFLAELLTSTPPKSLDEALNALKPKVVRRAEDEGLDVRRQGEWFAIPMPLSKGVDLMRDVERGIAERSNRHILGRDGHHELEEAIIYRAGQHKGEVYARGILRHINEEHSDLDLGTMRWHLIVHNVAGDAYTLTGKGTAQFD
jgi:hypothetical protein